MLNNMDLVHLVWMLILRIMDNASALLTDGSNAAYL